MLPICFLRLVFRTLPVGGGYRWMGGSDLVEVKNYMGSLVGYAIGSISSGFLILPKTFVFKIRYFRIVLLFFL